MTMSQHITPMLDTRARGDGCAAKGGSLFVVAAAHWAASSIIVATGAELAARFVPLCAEHPLARRSDLVADMAAWDGVWYREIAARGYHYDPNSASSVAFFPAHPLLAGLLSRTAGLRADAALLIVSNLSFLAAVLVVAACVRARSPESGGLADSSHWCVVALTWFPTTFYFRMAYSESLMLLLIALVMYGTRREWPVWWLAVLVGAATAVRPVGVALLAPLAMRVRSRRRGHCSPNFALGLSRSERRQWRAARLLAAAPVVLLACWGLAAFIAYQAWAFGEPLAFVKAHALWNHTQHHDFFWERSARLISFEPIRAVYDASTSSYWALWPPREHAAFNLMFANPSGALSWPHEHRGRRSREHRKNQAAARVGTLPNEHYGRWPQTPRAVDRAGSASSRRHEDHRRGSGASGAPRAFAAALHWPDGHHRRGLENDRRLQGA